MRWLKRLPVLFCFVATVSFGAPNDNPPRWADAVDAIGAESSLREAVDRLVVDARKEVSLGLVRRAQSLEEVGQHRTWLDGRSNALEDEIRTTFALAMSDFAACNLLSAKLPMVAAAARLTDDPELERHVLAQLQEMSAWSPLQRPGWTLYAPGHRLREDGKDGNWLATGCGVRAIVTTLEIMGGRVDAALRADLAALLEIEIAGVVDDWERKRPWFVSSDNPITNQWVLPTEGLVRACLHLGVEKHRDAYELGVTNLLKALDSHGAMGEFEEGIGYANFTLTSLLHAARAMAVDGDRRGADHPFLVHFPTWAVLHIQPGRMTVNCFDAGNAQIPRDNGNWRTMLSLLLFMQGSDAAEWALYEQFDGPSDDLIGLLSRVERGDEKPMAPPLYENYDRARMVVWRDGWKDDASGVWVRGGHELDQHDHQDRGHVNFIAHGKPILIEAGTPTYSNLDMGVHYSSGVGHNVLQVGTFFPERPYPPQTAPKYAGWQQRSKTAPIEVFRLDENGGEVLVEPTNGYAEVRHWIRDVRWTADELEVDDDVRLKSDVREQILFRWHLGTSQKVETVGEGKSWEIRWDDAIVHLSADTELVVLSHEAPDATVAPKEDNMHTCLEVTTRDAVNAANIRMKVNASPNR